jgi:hypothetical protein
LATPAIALTAPCLYIIGLGGLFTIAYVAFQRQEVRA